MKLDCKKATNAQLAEIFYNDDQASFTEKAEVVAEMIRRNRAKYSRGIQVKITRKRA